MGPRSKFSEFVSLLFPVQTVYLGKFCFTSYSKERISIFDFLHGDIQQEEVAESETILSQAYLAMPKFAKTCY